LGNYPLHLAILVLLWGYIYTSWSLMGRLGLVSFGHGAFMGIGAYTVVMLWNHFGLSPWIGALVAFGFTMVVAFVIGYPCFRFKIVGHYFALVTLALSEVARLVIVALRDQTGGSLGATPNSALHSGESVAIGAVQFAAKEIWLAIVFVFWVGGLVIWRIVDRSMGRLALQAISEEEEAAASIGIHVTRAKLRITMISPAASSMRNTSST
jgi:branched-chain amino acid transport system permease protein